jgi:hypothetical protein
MRGKLPPAARRADEKRAGVAQYTGNMPMFWPATKTSFMTSIKQFYFMQT